MPPRQNKDVTKRVRIDAATSARLDAIAADRGESVSVIVREAIRQYLARHVGPSATQLRVAEDPAGYEHPPPGEASGK